MVKKWYKSKTVWFNVAVGATAFTAALPGMLAILAPVLTVEVLKYTLFGVAVANYFLRRITSTGVE
jgi:hypothetical protein